MWMTASKKLREGVGVHLGMYARMELKQRKKKGNTFVLRATAIQDIHNVFASETGDPQISYYSWECLWVINI